MKKWICSAAGKTSIVLLFMSVSFVVLSWLDYGFFDNRTLEKINSILIGLAVSFIGIVVTISFVQYFFDKQDMEENQRREQEKILRYNRYLTILIKRYIRYFSCITTRQPERISKSYVIYNKKFCLKDMADMYKPSLYVDDDLFMPAIELWYKAEEELRNYMITMLESIEFEYNRDIGEILISFIEESKASDVKGVILKNQSIGCKGIMTSDTAAEYMKDDSKDWISMFDNNKLGHNMMHPYVRLYYLLKKEIDMIEKYNERLKTLKEKALSDL